jgi:Uma2 family endonuclease
MLHFVRKLKGVITLLSLEEYLALPAPEFGCEYDEGRAIEWSAHKELNSEIQSNVIISMGNFIRATGLDIAVQSPTGYWLTRNVERVPDVSLIRRAKKAAMERFYGSLRGAPDVAIEIVSPSESATELERKADQYLAAGVLAVILIYADTRHVHVCRPQGETRRLGPGEALEIPELLPGFKLPIDELFPAAAR